MTFTISEKTHLVRWGSLCKFPGSTERMRIVENNPMNEDQGKMFKGLSPYNRRTIKSRMLFKMPRVKLSKLNLNLKHILYVLYI